MRIAKYIHGGQEGYGAVTGEGIAPLATPESPTFPVALAREGLDGLKARAAKTAPSTPLSEVVLLAPIEASNKFICVGLNYHKHAREANMAVPSKPSLFVRFADSVVGHGQPVLLPPESEQFDYEAELAVVIGGPASGSRRVPQDEALSIVAGYTCLAENTIRDWQRHSAQATPGKNFLDSGALGPWIVTPDEAGDPRGMQIVGRLNGEVLQQDTISEMIFSIPEIIAYITSFTVLRPGDVIATGTPAGVGLGKKPPLWMKDGDVFEVDISSIGVLRNKVRREA